MLVQHCVNAMLCGPKDLLTAFLDKIHHLLARTEWLRHGAFLALTFATCRDEVVT